MKLDRDVALKVLPQAFTEDPDWLARFELEAKVLASLNHSGIAAIHGLERVGHDGRQAILFQLSLYKRIARSRPNHSGFIQSRLATTAHVRTDPRWRPGAGRPRPRRASRTRCPP